MGSLNSKPTTERPASAPPAQYYYGHGEAWLTTPTPATNCRNCRNCGAPPPKERLMPVKAEHYSHCGGQRVKDVEIIIGHEMGTPTACDYCGTKIQD